MSLTLKQIHDRCDEFGDCLLWRQSCTPNGYPRVSDGYAHIIAWECVHGPVPDGLRVRRRCDEKLCCNVQHMLLMTRSAQNKIAARRGAWKSAGRIAAITAKARARAKLDMAAVKDIRASDESGVVLAARYGVSRSLISSVRLRRAWAETTPGASVFNMVA